MSTVREEKTQFLSLREHSRELQSGRSLSRGCVPPARPKDGAIACSWDGVPARPGVLLPVSGKVSPPAPAAGETGHGRRLKEGQHSAPSASCSLRGFYRAKAFSFCAFRHEEPAVTRSPGAHARSPRLSAAPPPHDPQGTGARARRETRSSSAPQRTRSAMRDVTGREDSRELPTSRGFRENQQEP